MHRFVWNLHHGGPATTSDDSTTPKGVWAPPGVYEVELQANGKTLRQPLSLKPDPRVKVESSALMEEFELASKVQEAGKQAAAAVDDATALLKALARRERNDTAERPQIRALMDQISAVSGIPTPWDPRAARANPPTPPGSLKHLAAEFANLQDAVDDADAEPSPDSRAAYATLQTALGKQLQIWQQLKQANGSIANKDAGK
jgi:hypothetical protein